MKSIGDNLKLYRIRCGLSLTEAGRYASLSAPGLMKYEKNLINHSIDKLSLLADAYGVTLDDILKVDSKNEIKFNNLYVDNGVSEVKINNIKSIIQNKVDNYFELLDKSGIKLVNKFGVHIINSVGEAESLATKLRIFFQMSTESPISNLIYLLESHDIVVITLDKSLVTSGFKGFYETINNVPVIVVPKEKDGYEQRYKVAKYLGELLIVANSNKDVYTSVFALSFLIPSKALIRDFGSERKKINFNEIAVFSKIYRMSYRNIIKKLEDCSIISHSNAKYLNVDINKFNLVEQVYIEEALNYEQMLYRLNGLGIIDEVDAYL